MRGVRSAISARFIAAHFDAAAAREFAGADLVMMNGVLHHIGDEDLQVHARQHPRRPERRRRSVHPDACYREGQSPIAKWLLDNDRGEFVRDEDGYDKVLGNAFAKGEARHPRRLVAPALHVRRSASSQK